MWSAGGYEHQLNRGPPDRSRATGFMTNPQT